MADVDKLKQMADAVHQRDQERQKAADSHKADEFQTWLQTTLSPEMQTVLQLIPGWDQRKQQPMASFELGRERGRIYRGKDEAAALGDVIFTDPDGRETLPVTFHSEDELLLLIEPYL